MLTFLKHNILKFAGIALVLMLSLSESTAMANKISIPIENNPGTFPESIEESVIDPVYSPDGTMLSFSSNTVNSGALWLQSNSGSPSQIYQSKKKLYSTIWSPDGNNIAFLESEDETGSGYLPSKVLIYNLRSGLVTDTGAMVNGYKRFEYQDPVLEWSLDSKKMLICSNPIVVWDTDSLTTIQITEPGAKVQLASLSPSGNKVAYKKWGDNGEDILTVYDLRELKSSVISRTPFYKIVEWHAPAPQWLDENNLVMEVEYPDGRLGINKVNLTDKTSTKISYPASNPQVAPNKEYLAFIRRDDKSAGIFENATLDLNTMKTYNIPESTGQVMKWSKDSTKLLLWDLEKAMVVTKEGKMLKSPVPVKIYGWAPAWAPDGSHLVISGKENGKTKMDKLLIP
ncbi:TolB-like translocation protein [Paradesulfitobacterium ferrireducens]|uniref:PD40 domain-containing protein n=1 Tax=Paradesulfitobacterium ferrireducens TaxID=2816476 RepID=UPI001A90B90E|nr:PD40 domain-containing protein [Paradesulfitobacterium ferrireducens]